jgi:acyl-CoA reductase-like NAD-dependent aldehyde dehydrogenase
MTENDSTNSAQMPPDHLQPNKLYAFILIPLSVILIFITGASIFGKLSAPTPVIADEVPLYMRVLVDLFGFLGALAGVISGFTALSSSMKVGKLFATGNYDVAKTASDNAEKHGKSLPVLIGALGLLLIVKIFGAFF